MNRNNWKDVFEVVGITSLIITMAFVAYEIRQNTNAVRSSTIQDISRMSYDATILGIENADLRAARRAYCSGNPSDDQYEQLRLFYASLMRIQLNRFFQVRLGILDESEVLALGGRGGAYRSPFFSEIWPTVREEYPPGFVEYIEREVLPLSQETC